jgi:hypothetical protein
MVGSPGKGILADNLLRYSVTNRGHRPVTPVNVGGKLKDRRQFFCIYETEWSQLRTLAHSETMAVLVRDLSVLNDNLDCLWVTDSTGKQWKAPTASMKQLRASSVWGKHRPGEARR